MTDQEKTRDKIIEIVKKIGFEPFECARSEDGDFFIYYKNDKNKITFEIDEYSDVAYIKEFSVGSFIKDLDLKNLESEISELFKDCRF